MLLSMALIFTIGLVLSELFMKIRLPGFIGMILTGIILGPYVLDFIDGSILSISDELREIALIVILLRAGLSLDVKDLKIIGRPAILIAFIPATLEIVAVAIFAPILFGITLVEALVLGSVLAAVSPAVIVPKMIALIEQRYGEKKRIPHLIMAGASVDDIYVIVLFTIFTRMYLTGGFAAASLFEIPIAIILGTLAGLLIGIFLAKLFTVFRVRDTIKVLMMLSAAFFVIALEDTISAVIPFSGLLAVMVIGISFLNQSQVRAKRLQQKFSKIWVFAEVVLFVLVGAKVDITIALSAGLVALLLLVVELTFRIFGVGLSLIKTKYNNREKLFIGISYLPKATVQAAIGAIPLSLGMEHGELILALAVLSIIITAPLGAIGIDVTKDILLKKTQ